MEALPRIQASLKVKEGKKRSADGNARVAVIMPVYQGEAHLAGQIESVLNQTYSGFRLYIRDDGSSDKSQGILRHYARKDPRILIADDNLGRLGVTRSVKILLKNVQEDVVFFADQDDVWVPRKIETMLAHMLLEENKYRPMVIFSDLAVVDSHLKQTAASFWKMAGINPENKSFRHIIRRNCVTGCASAVNRHMAEIIKEMPDDALHDWWIAAIAANKGILVPVHKALVWYRQHGANTIGADRCGWFRIMDLLRYPFLRKKYLRQLRHSIVHLKILSSYPHISKGFVDRFFLLMERIRRTSFYLVLRIFS